jgi:tetratricopeptide (TPR) repeat protein
MMRNYRPSALRALAFSAALLTGGAAELFGRGAAELIAEGNAAMQSGRPAVAAARYEKARAAAPRSAVPLFDLGLALFRQNNYQAALAAFQAIEHPPPDLAAAVHYNQGNALARLGQEAGQSNPKAALDYYRQSIAAYKRALVLNPRYLEAATNLEVVRGWMAALIQRLQPSSQEAARQGQRGGSASPSVPGNQGNQREEDDSSGQQPPEPPDSSGQAEQGPDSPLQDTAQAILQEERARREAEAQIGGYSDVNPSW